MGKTYGKNVMSTKFVLEKLSGRNHLKNLCVHWKKKKTPGL
jgi:hypothetical protein